MIFETNNQHRNPRLNRTLGTLICLVTADGCGRQSRPVAEDNTEQAGLARSGAWGVFEVTRPVRTPHEVLRRAHAIGEIVLEMQLPEPGMLDGDDIQNWADVARAEPHRQSVIRFELEGRDILAAYRPTGDRLTVAAMDTRVRPAQFTGALDPGIGEADALVAAHDCLDRLEGAGVVGRGEFLRSPRETTSTPVDFGDEAWVERYNFVFNPDLDGLPLRSTELIISVNAWSAVCQRITLGGQVRLTRVKDAQIALRDPRIAHDIAKAKIGSELPDVNDVTMTGGFGYYLPFESTSGTLSPQFLVFYATQTSVGPGTSTSRKQFVGLSLDGRDALTDLLGPTWQ